MQVPAFYRFKLGDLAVTIISDGFIKGGETILRNIDRDRASEVLRANHRVPTLVNVNAFVVESTGRTMLIDTGSGKSMGRNAGLVGANLEAAGFSRSTIDTVFLTHIHPDHSGGLSADGGARFPNAELLVNAAEHAFWMDDANKSGFDDQQRAMFFDAARTQLAPYRNRLRLIEDGEIFPGVAAQRSPGHTPGHSTCILSSGADTLMIWGDTVHIPEVQTAYPDASVVFDVDAAAAAASRRRILDQTTTEQMVVLGMHLGFPGLSRVEREKQGYRLVALPWHRA